jgi:hypothetical protein
MLLWKRVAGIGLVALLLNAGLILLPGGDRFGMAQATGGAVVTDPNRTGEVSPTAGDPDGPTGDVAPPTHGSIDGPDAPVKQPVRRYTAWSEWTLAIKLWARFTFVR